jgi:cyclic beta-1,2-glucan synthetase
LIPQHLATSGQRLHRGLRDPSQWGDGNSRPLRNRAALVLFTLLALFIIAAGNASVRAADDIIRLSAATEQGTFNVGPARAAVTRVHDEAAGGDVLKLDFSLPPGTAAGVYAKSSPGGLTADRVDVVLLGAKAAGRDEHDRIVLAVEIKGSAGIQRIPLSIHSDWDLAEEIVNWAAIGTLKEVVVSVNPATAGKPATGSIAIDVQFKRLPLLRKLALSRWARFGGLFLLSLFGWVLISLLRLAAIRWPRQVRVDESEALRRQLLRDGPTWPRRLLRDLFMGAGTVFIAMLGLAIDLLGTYGELEVGWTPLGVAIAGAAVAEWWKYGLTGRHLSAGEVFQDMLASGLLAASASTLAILQPPATWVDVVLLSRPVAVAAALIYHAANAYRIASSNRHLGGAAAALIVGTPYVVGCLTLLESTSLLRSFGGVLAAGLLANRPEVLEFLGRVLVVFIFNEAVANGLCLATKRAPLQSLRAHVSLAVVAAAAVLAQQIAAWGSSMTVASWPAAPRLLAIVAATILSQGGLWAEAYLVTGMVMDAIHKQAPSRISAVAHPLKGMSKGMIYSGTFMGMLHVVGIVSGEPLIQGAANRYPILTAILFGAVAFPLLKTIIETFDGSHAFFRRIARSYSNPILYLRGAVVGLGLGYGLILGLEQRDLPTRAWFGFAVGALAFAGIDLLRDAFAAAHDRGRVQRARFYFVHALLGGFVGAAIAFYLDAAQVSVVAAKFHRYLAAGGPPERFELYPLVSKWGHLDLGFVSGGVSLLFAEALAGVMTWSTAAWLFAINRTFMTAYFGRELTPIKTLLTRDGLTQLGENMIQVLRWGLWMSPIINSFLRPMGEPTWYNQDGAIRTVIATVAQATLSPEAFRLWSLQIFINLLAYDPVRILIWVDHMGLRVATLVNLSFLGMDRLEQRLARALAPAATARCIPEAVKRFTTWGPLLIPFYIPRGADWDRAWSAAEAIRSHEQGAPLIALISLPVHDRLLVLAGVVIASTAAFSAIHWLRLRFGSRSPAIWSLGNSQYEVTLREDGAVASRAIAREYDLSRRSYDLLDPAGRALFIVDAAVTAGHDSRAWPVIGNFPVERASPSRLERDEQVLKVGNTNHGVRCEIEISLPQPDLETELWTITLQNLSDWPRSIKVVPYLEWVLNRPEADRGHTQYNRLFAEMEYVSDLHAILARDKHAKAMGFLASDCGPEGFLTSRIDFIGRARSLWAPRVLETLQFSAARDTGAHATFDPVGSLLLSANLPARGLSRLRLLLGFSHDKAQAIDLIAQHLGISSARSVPAAWSRPELHPIGHGEIPPGTPQPYWEFSEDGRRLLIRTPFTPRPYDHTMSNALGHAVAVTNRGLHTTSSVNSQQNRLTADWSDIVTRELPSEAFYLYDPDAREWFAPTYHPLNDARAAHEAEFGVDGSATFHMRRGQIETELTVFVPPQDPAGVYLLTVKNHADVARRLRLAPYFQIVLAGQPEYSGPLRISAVKASSTIFFENPRNTFRSGPAFVAMSSPAEFVETHRGRFFGPGWGVAHPYLVETGEPDNRRVWDNRPIAAMLTTLEIPAHGQQTVVVILGQADDRDQAEAVIRKYQDPDAALASLEETRRWWLSLMDTVRARTSNPELDGYLDWLKYQTLAERIWARRGFYQASGAYGFRDQLQDAVNLIGMDPVLAREQILLHAAQQFVEGDVVHWFHRLQDGRTGFVGRTHASDNHLWLAWGVVEYIGATGDDSLLEERVPYLESEQEFPPLPAGKQGIGFDPLRSPREDTIYRHCLKAIDLVLEKRMGAHGLPLMGTGDWNDGLDEIGSDGRGESVWLGFFLYYILERMAAIVGRKEGPKREEHYVGRLQALKGAVELTWRDDRYLRAIHDDGTEIGRKDSAVWEIDALTAAWAVMSGINVHRGQVVFETALDILEKPNTILLGWPPLREDTKPYLGRSSQYPEGVRENGMYCHGVQWLVGAARILAERAARQGRHEEAGRYLQTAQRLWLKIATLPHVAAGEVETYGGQPNQQAADMVTTFDPGRMIWNGYTGSAGWMFRQALESILGLRLQGGAMVPSTVRPPNGELTLVHASRDLSRSPLPGPPALRPPSQHIASKQAAYPT